MQAKGAQGSPVCLGQRMPSCILISSRCFPRSALARTASPLLSFHSLHIPRTSHSLLPAFLQTSSGPRRVHMQSDAFSSERCICPHAISALMK